MRRALSGESARRKNPSICDEVVLRRRYCGLKELRTHMRGAIWISIGHHGHWLVGHGDSFCSLSIDISSRQQTYCEARWQIVAA